MDELLTHTIGHRGHRSLPNMKREYHPVGLSDRGNSPCFPMDNAHSTFTPSRTSGFRCLYIRTPTVCTSSPSKSRWEQKTRRIATNVEWKRQETLAISLCPVSVSGTHKNPFHRPTGFHRVLPCHCTIRSEYRSLKQQC